MLQSDNMITWYDLHMSTQWCMNCLGVIPADPWITGSAGQRWICCAAAHGDLLGILDTRKSRYHIQPLTKDFWKGELGFLGFCFFQKKSRIFTRNTLWWTNIAIEHGHWNSGFSHEKWWFFIAMLVHQRVKWMNDGDKSRVLLNSTHPSQKFTWSPTMLIGWMSQHRSPLEKGRWYHWKREEMPKKKYIYIISIYIYNLYIYRLYIYILYI